MLLALEIDAKTLNFSSWPALVYIPTDLRSSWLHTSFITFRETISQIFTFRNNLFSTRFCFLIFCFHFVVTVDVSAHSSFENIGKADAGSIYLTDSKSNWISMGFRWDAWDFFCYYPPEIMRIRKVQDDSRFLLLFTCFAT